MVKRTRETYEQVIKLAYEGYTTEGIAGVTRQTAANVSSIIKEAGVLLKDIRDAKRNGKTLGMILEGVDWSFMTKKHYGGGRKKNLPVNGNKSAKAADVSQDIAEIKVMLTEIYAALTIPAIEHKPSLMSRVTGLRN